MAKSDFRAWAIKGAEQRLVEMTEEAKAIFASFPELRAQGRGLMLAGGARAAGVEVGRKQAQTGRRRKRTMSAEARKRIGDAQRKRWAAVKANKAAADQRASPAAISRMPGSRKKR